MHKRPLRRCHKLTIPKRNFLVCIQAFGSLQRDFRFSNDSDNARSILRLLCRKSRRNKAKKTKNSTLNRGTIIVGDGSDCAGAVRVELQTRICPSLKAEPEAPEFAGSSL